MDVRDAQSGESGARSGASRTSSRRGSLMGLWLGGTQGTEGGPATMSAVLVFFRRLWVIPQDPHDPCEWTSKVGYTYGIVWHRVLEENMHPCTIEPGQCLFSDEETLQEGIRNPSHVGVRPFFSGNPHGWGPRRLRILHPCGGRRENFSTSFLEFQQRHVS